MSYISEAAPAGLEQTEIISLPDGTRPPDLLAGDEGIQAHQNDQMISSNILPEMPAAHSEVDPAALTVQGIIKSCPYYFEKNKIDPEATEADVSEVLVRVQDVSAMRKEGKSDKEIRSKMLADNLSRFKEKLAAKEKVVQPKTKTEKKISNEQEETSEFETPVDTTKPQQLTRSEQPEQAIDIVETQPQVSDKPAEAAITRAVEPVINQPLEIAGDEPSNSGQPSQQESFQPAGTTSKAEGVEEAAQPKIVLRGQDKAEDNNFSEPLADPLNINLQPEIRNARPQPKEADATKQVEVIIPTPPEILDTSTKQAEDYFELPVLETEALSDTEDTSTEIVLSETENFGDDYEFTELKTTYQIPEIDNKAAVAFEVEAYTDEQLEVLFEPETIETYKELVALIDNGEIEPLGLEEAVEVQTDVSFGPIKADVERYPVNNFEAFIAEQPVIEESITLETILEQANEHPLEQTLVQLTELLAKDAEDEPTPALIELHQILREIEAELPACYYISQETQETEEPKLKITPELTEKLLTLLRHLGHDHPKEALVGIVRQYGFAFLLQALQYICQLNSEYERQEFLTAPALIINGDDEDTRLRIGKALFGLISEFNFEPASSANFLSIKQIARIS